MSQHYFQTSYQQRPVQVLMGWDRPLQGFFMVIERLDAKGDEEQYVYSNLDDLELNSSHPKDLKPFLSRLESLKIVVPQKMLQDVLADQVANVGNKIVHH